MISDQPQERAYLAPFFAFLGFLLLADFVARLGDGYAHWALAEPRYWVFPVQTLTCAGLLWRWRAHYPLARSQWRGLGLACGAGLLSLALWVAPQWLLGAAPRVAGFDPGHFGSGGALYGGNLALRLLRMVVVVPLVEEIFWRGWLLRFLVKEDFQSVPMGTFTRKSFAIVSVAFCFEHTLPDWPGALITSVLYNLVAIRTRSLGACVLAHAVTNFGLALYILATKQWGFW